MSDSVLTYLQQAHIRDSVRTLEGEVMTRPMLHKTDGVNLTYACDVRVSTDDPRGEPWKKDVDPVLGERDFGRVLHSVPIAVGNRDLIYAEVGSAVTLARSSSGRFEVIGFSKRKPGTRKRVAVNLTPYDPASGSGGSYPIGTPADVGMSSRLLTFGELATLGGGYGVAPYGAYGIFIGGNLVEVRT